MGLLIFSGVYLALGIVTGGFVLATAPRMDGDGVIWLSLLWPVFWLAILGYEIGKALYGETVDYSDTKKSKDK